MANGGKIQFGIEFKPNKQSLIDIENILKQLSNMTLPEYLSINKGMQIEQAKTELMHLQTTIDEVRQALQSASNIKLGSVNIQKFSNELAKSKTTIQDIYNSFSKAGQTGQNAFKKMTVDILTTNTQLKQSHKLLDQMATTMANTVRFGISSSIFNSVTSSIQRAYSYSKELNTSLNNIRIVTEKSAEDMADFAVQANKAAKALGQTTTAYTDASLIYYQQGLEDEDVAARTDVTLKAANVTGQTAAQVSEQLTAVWNGYKVNAEETEAYVDRLAAVAAASASDLEELSTGISKVASAANTAGVDIDQLTAQVATITSVTREAPETIGNSLKTIYARFGDLAINGTDEFGVSLGKVSSQLEAVGVKVLDDSGSMREMGDIFEDLAAQWKTWSAGQKQAVAVAAAGKMQYARLMTLMENWDMYENMLATSQNSLGALQNQQDIYMESTEAHLQKLTTSWERMYDSLFNDEAINGVIDGLTTIVDLLGNFIDATGKGGKSLLALGAIGTQVFGKQITQGIATFIGNKRTDVANVNQVEAGKAFINSLENTTKKEDSSLIKEFLGIERDIYEARGKGLIDNEQFNQMQNAIKSGAEVKILQENWAETIKNVNAYYSLISDKDIDISNATDLEFEEVYSQANEFADSLDDIQDKIKIFNKSDLSNIEDSFLDLGVAIEDFTNNDKFKLQGELNDDFGKLINQFQTEFSKISNLDDLTNFDQNSDFGKALQNWLDKIKEIKKESDAAENAPTRAYSPSSEDIQNLAAYNEQVQRLKDLRMADAITHITQGVTSLSASLTTLTNIPAIFTNEDLTSGEKFLQIIIALSTGIPMLITGWKALSGGLKEVAFAHLEAAGGAGVQSAANLGLTATLSGVAAAAWAALAPLLPFIAIGAAVAAVVYTVVKALNADSDALNKATEEAKELKNAYTELKQSYSELVNELEDYAGGVNALKKLEEGTLEWKQAVLELNEQVLALIDKYPMLAQFLSTTKEGYLQISESGINKLLEQQFAQVQGGYRASLTGEIEKYEAQLTYDKNKFKKSISYMDENEPLFNMFDLSQKGSVNNKNNLLTDNNNNKLYIKNNDLLSQNIQSNKEVSNGLFIINNQLKDNSNLLSKNTQSLQQQPLLDKTGNYTYDRLLPGEKLSLGDMGTPHSELSEGDYNKLIKALDKEGLSILENAATLQEKTGIESKNLVRALYDNKESIIELNKTRIENNNLIKTAEKNRAASYMASESKSYQKLGQEDKNIIDELVANRIKNISAKEQEELNTKYDRNWLNQELTDKELHAEYAKLKGYDMRYAEDNWGKATFKDEEGKELEKISDDKIASILKEEGKLAIARSDAEKQYIKSLEQINKVSQEIVNNANLGYTESSEISTLIKSGINKNATFDFSTATDEQLEVLKNAPKDQLNKIAEEYAKLGYTSAEVFKKNFDESLSYWSSEEKTQERQRNRIAKIDAEYNEKISIDAEALKIDESALRSYTEHLMEANEQLRDDKLAAEEAAVAAIKFGQGLESLGKALSSNEQLLKDWKNGLTDSTEAYAAVGQVQDAIEQMFGVRVSNNYVKEHLEELEQLANGDTSALTELQEAAAKDYLFNIKAKMDEDSFNKMNDYIEQYVNDTNIEIGASINDQAFIDTLNDMLEKGEITEEEVNKQLNAIGYEPVMEPVSAESEGQTIHSKSQVSFDPGGKGGLIGSMNLGTIHTDTTVDGVDLTMFGIHGKGEGSNSKKVKDIKRVSDSRSRASAVKNSGASGKKVGKSGSGSKKEAKKEDKVEDEKDRYHDVNIQLKQIETNLNRLQKAQEKLFGQKLIDNLSKQWEQLAKQIETTNRKIEIANGEMSELQSKLAGQGVIFNDDGTMANYAAAYDAKLAYLNSVIDRYNGMSAEEQEKFQDTLDQAKEDFDKFVEDMERYDEVVTDLIPSLQDEIQEAYDEQIQIQISKFNMEIEIRLDMHEAEKTWDAFRKKVLLDIKDTDILGNAAYRAENEWQDYYNDAGTGIIEKDTTYLDSILKQLNQYNTTGISDVYGDNLTALLEDLDKANQNLQTHMEEFYEQIKQTEQDRLDMMDEANEKMEEQVGYYEQIHDLIEHDRKVLELVYGEQSYGDFEQYYAAQQKNYNEQLAFQRQQVEFWRQQMDAAEKGSDQWESAKEKWITAVNEWNSAVEAAIENAIDKYENALNRIFKDLNNKVTGGLGLDYVSEQWDLIKKKSDQYLDTVNGIYQVQKLSDKYTDALDATDSISGQRKLKKLMEEEIEYLQQQDKLTQNDIDRANLKYEIALKQIALEEAQQNKSTMRLKRDSQGNYSYVFTEDESETDKLRGELSDLYNQLYNFDYSAYQGNLEQIYTLWDEYQQKMFEAALINDPEERAQREALLKKEYGDLINGYVKENEKIRHDLYESTFLELKDFYWNDEEAFQNTLGSEYAGLEGMIINSKEQVDSFSSGWHQMVQSNLEDFANLDSEVRDVYMANLVGGWNSGIQHMIDIFAGEGGFEEVCKEAWDQISQITQDYKKDLEDVENSSGQTFDSIKNGLDSVIDQTKELTEKNNELFNTYKNNLSVLDDYIRKINEIANSWKAALAEKMAYEGHEAWKKEQDKAAEAANNANKNNNQNSNTSPGNNNNNNNNSGGSASSGGSGGSGNNADKVEGVAAAIWMLRDKGGWYDGRTRYARLQEKFGTERTVQDIVNSQGPNGQLYAKWKNRRNELDKFRYGRFNTGGYTGDWPGSEGKLSILDSKELVLNKDDTSNVLNAVNILRNITSKIGTAAMAQMAAIKAPTSSVSASSDTLEQDVYIEASFPGVRDAKEIENAMDNLINVASQRTHKSRR